MNPNSNSLSEIIEGIETRHDVKSIFFEYEDERFELYPIIKQSIFSQLQRNTETVPKSRFLWFQMKSLFKGFWNRFRKFDSIVLSNSLEKRSLGGELQDKLFQDFLVHEKLGKVLNVEFYLPPTYLGSYLPKGGKLMSRSSMILTRELRSRLFNIKKVRVQNEDLLQDILNELKLDFDVNYKIKNFLMEYKMVTKFLKKTSPKCLFLSNSSSFFAWIKAANNLGIKVVEIQHGVINAEHYGYNFQYKPDSHLFPNYFLSTGSRDDVYIQNISKIPIHKSLPLGSYILDYYLRKENEPIKIGGQVKTLAISLQDCEWGKKGFGDLVKLAKALPEVTFKLKTRRLPISFYRENYELAKNMVFEMDKDIYQLILDCDIHLSLYSSCLIEANALGRANVIFNYGGKGWLYYQDKLPPSSHNLYCDSVEEMKKAIEAYRVIDGEQIQKSNQENIHHDYSKNLDHALNLILN